MSIFLEKKLCEKQSPVYSESCQLVVIITFKTRDCPMTRAVLHVQENICWCVVQYKIFP